MQISVTFRKLDASDAVKNYAEEKVQKIKKYFPDPINVHVVLSKERYQQRADINITLHNGLVIKGHETSEEAYSSIDLAIHKIEKQVRRYKDKIRNHKPQTGPQLSYRRDIIEEDRAEFEAEERAESAAIPGNDGGPAASDVAKVIRSDHFTAQPMSVEEAVMQLNLLGDAFLVFTNAKSKAINVVYKRNDGNYGLIDTA